MARAPACCNSAAFCWMPSIASILKPHQSAQTDRRRARLRQQVGHLVGLDRVVERADLEAELLRQVEHLRHLVGAVAVVLHGDLAAQHLGQRLERAGPARGGSPFGAPSIPRVPRARYSSAAMKAAR